MTVESKFRHPQKVDDIRRRSHSAIERVEEEKQGDDLGRSGAEMPHSIYFTFFVLWTLGASADAYIIANRRQPHRQYRRPRCNISMKTKVGVVGLPNVGKSTLFNALSRKSIAAAENYPFCTIEPNTSPIAMPDDRLERLAAMAGSRRAVSATLQLVDVAGLVRGASRGEGLGNKFLATIRECDVILHVVRK